jgi:CRISPR-associated protein Cas2
MLILVCYDVSTETTQGRRRLRRVAKVCEAVGQRVQKSIFECQVNQMEYEELERTLLEEIEPLEDCLRFYRITAPLDRFVKEYGKFKATDFDGPLIV